VSTDRSPIEERLLGPSHPPGSAEELAAIHLRSAANRRPPSPMALARVRTRLGASTAPSTPTGLRWKTILAVIALSIGVGGATGAAMWVAMPILKRARSTPAAPIPEPKQQTRVRLRRGHLRPSLSPSGGSPQTVQPDEPEAASAPPATFGMTGPTFGPEPAAEPAPGTPQTESVAPGSTSPSLDGSNPRSRVAKKLALVEPAIRPARPIPMSTPPASAMAQDAEMLGRALRSLRRDHDPRAALAALDAHAARFPDSALAPEADITRVDALLALDRRQSALAVLDRLIIPSTTRGRELAVVRAELRAGARRCPQAIADFTRTLAEGGGDALCERALHGRIACYLATGNEALAVADLRQYLIRFPAGRFAPGVRRTLSEIDKR
jgi:hypothetical protein